MATQSFLLQLQTAALDIPIPVCYGLVRGTGNKVAQVEAADKTIYAAYAHGIGPWNRIVRCWIDRKAVNLPSANVHFHEGGMGEIGSGMSATSTGGDQKVDAFFANFPGGTDFITYSGLAYTFIKRPPDPGAPSADPEFLADFEALLCRRFDNTGAQVAFDWTQNQVWWEVDKVIRAFIKREQKLTKTYAEPLLTAEKNRFDWALIKDAADYCDADIGGGVKRFSDGGVVWIQDGLTLDRALEQLHLMCRGFIQEINGKIAIRIKKNDAPGFTMKLDHIEPGSFKLRESRLFDLYNQVVPAFRDYSLASGSSDDATRFSDGAAEPLNHESAQLYAGGRAPGLAPQPSVKPVLFDYGNNSPERVWRLMSSFLREELGEEAGPGTVYKEPPEAEVVALEETLEVIPGDVITVDKGISEEHGGKDYRVREVVERANGSRLLVLKRHNANAYPDVAPSQQATQAPSPGTGIALGQGISTTGNPQGNIPATAVGANLFSWYLRQPTPSGPGIFKLQWPARTFYRADGSTLAVPASSSLAVTAAPTLSEVAGGALGARTRYVRIGLVRKKMIYGISAESSLAINANNLLRCTSPAADADYDGWIPLVGTAADGEQMVADAAVTVDAPLPFGTDWTEPATGFVWSGTTYAQDQTAQAGQGMRRWDMAVSTTYYWYTTLRVDTLLPFMPKVKITAADAEAAAEQSGDGNIALANGALNGGITQPAGSSSGSGSGGSGGGGRGTL